VKIGERIKMSEISKVSFYYLKHKDESFNLKFDLDNFEPLPIIWNCCGLMSMLSKEAVENIISIAKDYEKIKDRPGVNVPTAHTVYWDELKPVTLPDFLKEIIPK